MTHHTFQLCWNLSKTTIYGPLFSSSQQYTSKVVCTEWVIDQESTCCLHYIVYKQWPLSKQTPVQVNKTPVEQHFWGLRSGKDTAPIYNFLFRPAGIPRWRTHEHLEKYKLSPRVDWFSFSKKSWHFQFKAWWSKKTKWYVWREITEYLPRKRHGGNLKLWSRLGWRCFIS